MFSSTPLRSSRCAAATATCGATPATLSCLPMVWPVRIASSCGGMSEWVLVTLRPSQKISVTGEVEGACEQRRLFPHQPLQLSEGARAGTLSAAPVAEHVRRLHAAEQSQSAAGNQLRLSVASGIAVAVLGSPRGGKVFDLQGSYSRSDLRSNIGYLEPEPCRRSFRVIATTPIPPPLLDLTWPAKKRFAPKLAAGGSFFISSGSRPTSYYQPVAKLWVPLGKHASWFTEWRYYGYGETFYLYRRISDAPGHHGSEVHTMRPHAACSCWLRAIAAHSCRLYRRFRTRRAPVSNAFLR